MQCFQYDNKPWFISQSISAIFPPDAGYSAFACFVEDLVVWTGINPFIFADFGSLS